MHQFHLSMQSGSAGVLKRMRRRYTPEEYFEALEKLRRYMPDSALTTDVLTGFPGETEVEAQETLAFVEKCAFARIHVFPYSRRAGTVADKMPDQVPEPVKKERCAELIRLGNKMEKRFVKDLVGTVQQVLFEEEEITEDGVFAGGYTGQYVRVRAKASPGDLCAVRIIRAEGTQAYGEVLERV